MPGSVSVSSPRVEPELLHYLDVSWQSIIAADVDGTAATPYKVDQSAPNLNRYSATRRVARAIFMGTAPTHQQQNTGLDDKQINLGVVQPGERPAIFGDALRRLTNQAKFMHADLGRYWYSMSASLNRIAADRAAQLESALVLMTIDNELTKYINGIADREIVRDIDRLNLTQSDSALAKAKLTEANDTVKTRLKEAWCYLHYPVQESAQAEVEWVSGKVPAQDGLLARASKKLVAEEGLLPELGPTRLDRDLQKYIWNGKPHLSLKDLWEYLNRYTYLPRLKDEAVLVKTIQAAVSGMLPGPFAYAERWDDKTGTYLGLAIERAANAAIVIDRDSVIISPDVAELNRPAPVPDTPSAIADSADTEGMPPATGLAEGTPDIPPSEHKPTRFFGTVMISAERPAREIHQIVEAIVEQITTIPGSEVSLKLEIDAEVPTGLDRAKVRTLIENANTLGFLEKDIR